MTKGREDRCPFLVCFCPAFSLPKENGYVSISAVSAQMSAGERREGNLWQQSTM